MFELSGAIEFDWAHGAVVLDRGDTAAALEEKSKLKKHFGRFDMLFFLICAHRDLPALIKLRYSHRDVERPYRVPFGIAGVWLCGVLTTFWAVLASIVGHFPGLGDGSLLDDEALPDGFSRATLQLVVFVPLVVTLATGVLFYVLGRKTREQPPAAPIEAVIPPAPSAS